MRGVLTKLVLAAGLIAAVVAAVWWSFVDLQGEEARNPLQDAATALLENDESGYELAVSQVLAEGARVPELFRQALEIRDIDLLESGAAMLASDDVELYEIALTAIAEEQSLLPERPAALPERPAALPVGPPPPAPRNPAAAAADQFGRATLDQLDYRRLVVPEPAREVLALAPRPGLPIEPPRPVTYEAARREIREHLAAIPDTTILSLGLFRTFGPVALIVVVLGCGAVRTWGRRHEELVDLATTDGLTGLKNRRQLDADLEAHTDQGAAPTALLMVDVDHFKSFNDTYGHSTGDEVLKQVADTVSACIREYDIAYRYGGEEFCVLLPNAYILDAVRVAERIRDAVEAIDLPVSAKVTASVGVASGSADDVMNVADHADRALYAAKAQGRNCVVIS
jgi:diguanylate cyclase (GGDEF)-like protein